MKVATFSVAVEPRVGRVSSDGTSIAPFDLSISEAQDGVLALSCDPPKYLKSGDVVRIETGGIGVLENEIVERSP